MSVVPWKNREHAKETIRNVDTHGTDETGLSIMHRSMMMIPSLNKLSVNARLKSIQAASLTSINLNQQPLLKQPVPELNATLERYLKSVRPLLRDKEYQKTVEVVKDFQRGVGVQLQRELLKRYENTVNWVQEWFLNAAYLAYRDPVLVFSSPGVVGPPQTFSSPDDVCIFAARLISAVHDYDSMIKSGKIKQEMAGKNPLDMQQYALILGTHRRPGLSLDSILHTDNSKHIIVAHNNHFFKLELYDEQGHRLVEDQLVASIRDIVERSQIDALPVGILTGNNRDDWGSVHEKLRACGGNDYVLQDIENAMFLLCLDKAIPKNKVGTKSIVNVKALQSLTGFSRDTNSGNRWHDKTLQYIVSYDGFVGMGYEHSPCEGGPTAVLHDYVLNSIAQKRDNKCLPASNYPRANALKFAMTKELEDAVNSAAARVQALSDNIDLECFTFTEFGRDQIKKNRMSPDSFIQTAMQLTYYRIHNEPPAHYESAGLRRYWNARTECIRSTSVESVAFARTMLSAKTSTGEKKDALALAIDAHKKLASEATVGEGVDRHLFGLKKIATLQGIQMPEIFKDVAYARSTHFTVTSSQVPYKTASFMCYGPVVPDGYGCCYNPRANDILIACSSFNASKKTDTKKFAEGMKLSLREMNQIAETG